MYTIHMFVKMSIYPRINSTVDPHLRLKRIIYLTSMCIYSSNLIFQKFICRERERERERERRERERKRYKERRKTVGKGRGREVLL